MYPVSNHSGNGASGVCPCVQQRVYNRVDSKVAGIATLRRNTANRSADFVYRGEGNMCVYRQGEISHSSAASEGPIIVQYTEIRHMISFMKSQMWESLRLVL